MGVVACLLFGIIAAWITRSIMGSTAAGSMRSILLCGLAGGLLGLTGTALGWGDFESFNLYNVFLSIAATALLTTIYTKMQPKAKLTD